MPEATRPSVASTLATRPANLWIGSLCVTVLSVATGLVFWHVASDRGWHLVVNFTNVPNPEQVFLSTVANFSDPTFYTHIGVSIRRVAISFALASAAGILIGVAMARSRIAYAAIVPYIEIMRPIPAVAWIPLAILMWPTEEGSIIFITFLGAFFPIVLNTMHGVQQTPQVLIRAAESLGAGKAAMFFHVVFPAALPSISAGLAIGMGVAWFSLLAGEIISGQYGIGYFTWDAYALVRTPDIVLGMLVIGVLGMSSTAAIKALTRPLLRWQASSL